MFPPLWVIRAALSWFVSTMGPHTQRFKIIAQRKEAASKVVGSEQQLWIAKRRILVGRGVSRKFSHAWLFVFGPTVFEYVV